MTILIILAFLILTLLTVAWYDGGRQQQRLIVEKVDLSEVQQ